MVPTCSGEVSCIRFAPIGIRNHILMWYGICGMDLHVAFGCTNAPGLWWLKTKIGVCTASEAISSHTFYYRVVYCDLSNMYETSRTLWIAICSQYPMSPDHASDAVNGPKHTCDACWQMLALPTHGALSMNPMPSTHSPHHVCIRFAPIGIRTMIRRRCAASKLGLMVSTRGISAPTL